MIVIIAEKPSVARDLARIVGARNKQEGYIEGNGYMVTWAFGHLIQLAMPDAYGIDRFRKDNLPIIPESFKHIVRQTKSGKDWKTDSSANKQLKVIKEVFNQSDKIIVATDAGKEGELIFRLIYNHLKCDKPFERLWISSLTDNAIKDGLNNLRTGKNYDSLYDSAKARSEADWLVGINATQAMTLTAGGGTYSLGRVQTPTLSMVCSRFLENKNFQPSKYWQIKVEFLKFNQPYKVLSDEKWDNIQQITDILNGIPKDSQIKVDKIESKQINQEPPLLYDLTELQKEANKKLGLSAEKTLSIVQGLYEKKYMTYPRTGSRYISEDVFAEIPSRIYQLSKYDKFKDVSESLSDVELNRKSVNDSKVTDHHALLPTEIIPKDLSGDEKEIYEMVAKRMLEAFSGKCIKEQTKVLMSIGDLKFPLTGSSIKIMGWRKIGAMLDMTETYEEDTEVPNLPEFYEAETLPVKKITCEEKQTRPKPLHTEASLLAAMETAGKEIEDVELRESIKDSGIGTPATRANIIETLLTRGYIERKKKQLVPTEKGLAVYEAVKDMQIANVELTGNWEKQLGEIEKGSINYEEFMEGIKDFTKNTIGEIVSLKISVDVASPHVCPKCQTGRLKLMPKLAKCNNPECDFIMFRNMAGKVLSDKQFEDILKKGKSALIKGFKSKAGKSFDAHVILGDDLRLTFQFPDRK
ncbi:MAG: DNA topoisomerase 3 [Muribaculaceae bacterium]|nr:DNA topoisomerase 3 [Muribaculaceae bacterium]